VIHSHLLYFENFLSEAGYAATFTTNSRKLVHVQPCYKSGQKVEIETENK